jgi:PAS domain S-box-containing protein
MAGLLLTIMTTVYFVIEEMKERLIITAGETMAQLASEMTSNLAVALRDASAGVRMIADDFATAKSTRLTERLQGIQSAQPMYQWVAVVDGSGRMVASTETTDISRDPTRFDWFQTSLKRASIFVYDLPRQKKQPRNFAILVNAPLQEKAGEFQGAVIARVALPRLIETINRTVQVFEAKRRVKIDYHVITDAGDVIFDSLIGPTTRVNHNDRGRPSVLLVGAAGRPGYVVESGLRRDTPVIIGYAHLEGQADAPKVRWGVLVAMQQSDALAALWGVYWKLAVAGALVAIFMLMILLLMRKVWRERTQSSEKEKWLTSLVTSLGHAVIVVDARGLIAYMNPLAESITGCKQEEALGRIFKETFSTLSERTGRPIDWPLSGFPSQGQSGSDHKILLGMEGAEKPVDLVVSPINNTEGEVLGMVLSFRDRSAGERDHQERLQDLKRRLRVL